MEFWRFSDLSARGYIETHGSYDAGIVAVSVLIAVFSAYAMLTLADRISQDTDQNFAKRLHFIAAMIMGVGSWSMHLTGIHSFYLPYPMKINLLFTGMSLLPSVLGSYFALRFYLESQLRVKSLLLGSLCLAAGIGAMHYLGMEAMNYEGVLFSYDGGSFVLALLLTYIFAIAAFYSRRLTPGGQISSFIARGFQSLLIGISEIGRAHV